MLICPRYRKCKVTQACPHRGPHEEIHLCLQNPCGSTRLNGIVCEEELYVYMKEAIHDKGK